MKKLLTYIGILLFVEGSAQTISPSGASTSENYIFSRTYLEAVTTSSTSAKQVQGITYFDGLGRPKQSISIKATPAGKDMVTPIEYDGFGRQIKDWLPLPQTTTGNGVFNTAPNTSFYSSFTGANLYSEKKIEFSPLDRLQEQGHPGTDWNIGTTHTQKFDYDTNGDDEVKKYTATFNDATFTATLVEDGFYTQAQLYKNKVTDEDGNISYEYKNGKGQTVLVRKVLSATQNADTYYVYNEYDQLAFVIPPLASASTLTSTLLDQLCYQYKYDSQNRLVEKKLPGKGWEYLVYDLQDRLVATQDANMRLSSQWLFTKYDQFGRVAYTGTFTGASRATEQATANNAGRNNVERTGSVGFTQNYMSVYYTNTAYPSLGAGGRLLSINYYDAYPPDMAATLPASIQGQNTLTAAPSSGRSTKGLPLASYIATLEDYTWTFQYTFYDTKARPIATYSQNHLGGYTRTETLLDFAGLPQNTFTYHRRSMGNTEVLIKERWVYDAQNRLLQHFHQVNANPEELLAENIYNELSQLKTKKVGGTPGAPVQTLDYAYNIRGWLSQINDPTALGSDLFGYKISYTASSEPSTAPGRYNGNIAEVLWKSAYANKQKKYLFQYDGLNRLKAGLYRVPLSATPETDFYTEKTAYDLNGNITSLQRFSAPYGSTSTPMKVDDLAYTYSGNQLQKIQDTSNNYNGYPAWENTIDYDANGNMSNHLDKDIQTIQYNILNLPKTMVGIETSSNFAYRADGVKVSKAYNYYGFSYFSWDYLPTYDLTEYLDGFQYLLKDMASYNLYNYYYYYYPYYGPYGPQSHVLKFVPTAEGYYDFTINRYIYQYKDHLGNVRLSYYKGNNGAVIERETDYYPFGLQHDGNNIRVGSADYYQYKYNGKELQETGMYDYGARFYMPDIGRWGVVDPLAEKYPSWSPYVYTLNNPIKYIDPDGREPDWIKNGDGTYTAEKGDSAWSLHKQTGISFAKAQQLLSEQGKSNLQVGDEVRVNNQTALFINGKLGFGSPEGGEGYWDKGFVNEAKKFTGSNLIEFENVDYNYGSSAESRYLRGYNNTMKYGGSPAEKGDQAVIITHSMGGAYGEGVADAMKKQGWNVTSVYHFSAFQAGDISAGKGRKTIDFQATNDPVINNPIRSSPGSINGALPIRIISNSDYSTIHRSPIDNSNTWKIIKKESR